MTHIIALALVAFPLILLLYSYAGYPAILWIASRWRAEARPEVEPTEWPSVTIIVPCYNEEQSIGRTIEALLALDYPRERLHLLVISDASTDRTDEIVHSFASWGVELLRLPVRGGKSAAENGAGPYLRGNIVVNTDATTRIPAGSLKQLMRAFMDPSVGVATGYATSVGDLDAAVNRGESGYLSYEMWVRTLETRLGTIVGASGCFFASRVELYVSNFPIGLSRDFASCLIAHDRGYRAVSMERAVCHVPLSSSVRNEFRRKVRTMARGLDTLWYMRHLLNPFRHGWFSVMLFSHKLARWLFQLTFPLGVIGVALLGWGDKVVILTLAGAALILSAIGMAAMLWPEGRPMLRVVAVPGYAIWANIAGVVAWLRFFQRKRNPIWEPTRRPALHSTSAAPSGESNPKSDADTP